MIFITNTTNHFIINIYYFLNIFSPIFVLFKLFFSNFCPFLLLFLQFLSFFFLFSLGFCPFYIYGLKLVFIYIFKIIYNINNNYKNINDILKGQKLEKNILRERETKLFSFKKNYKNIII